ncbi:MAG: TfoX/Sxy family protein [Beijerinckiaceae bacterium]
MDAESVEDFFAPFARVRAKRMFSGHGVYVDDACIALCVLGAIWIKTDSDKERAALEAAGSEAFNYTAPDGGVRIMNAFWKLPDAALDDEDELRRWCRPALEAARRTAAEKALKKARKAAKPGGAKTRAGKTARSRSASAK